MYVLASNSLYTYNKNDQSIKTYDKVNGLSDTDIRFIAWNKIARRLVIIYSNNNIDRRAILFQAMKRISVSLKPLTLS